MGGICPCCSKTPVVVPAPTPTSSASATPFRSPTPRLLTPAPSYKAPRIDTPFSEHKYLPEASFTNVGVSANNPLRLIQGYKNEPLVSLEEALTPFYSKIDHLADHIREAKSKCYFSPEQGLTRDESAALHIYASQWGEDCLYNKLQAAWKSESPAQMKPWLKYLKLFKNGYDKLPDAKGEIWQGTSFDPALNDQLTAPSLDMYSAMGACSSSRKLVEEYLEDRGDREKIILGFRAIGAKSLGPYASNGTGDTILWPGAKIGLANLEVFDETGSVIFHLTGKTKPESAKKPLVVLEKHFICCNDHCDNRCSGKHDPNHCHGYDALFHTCRHHCGPTHTCFRCGQHASNVFQCKKCERRWCSKCFNRYAMIPEQPKQNDSSLNRKKKLQ